MEKINKIKTDAITARVNSHTAEFFKGYKLQGTGALSSLVMDTFPILYKTTVQKIKKKFSHVELLVILSVFNGKTITPGIVSNFHYTAFEALKHTDLSEYPNFDKDEFLKKAASVSRPESFIIEVWANTFWYGGTKEEAEEYIQA